jgi:hypothetical protein
LQLGKWQRCRSDEHANSRDSSICRVTWQPYESRSSARFSHMIRLAGTFECRECFILCLYLYFIAIFN